MRHNSLGNLNNHQSKKGVIKKIMPFFVCRNLPYIFNVNFILQT